MSTEAEIRGAERARLEAIVREHGTEGEQFQLRLSGLMRNGFTLGQYLGEEPVGHLAPDPELLAQLARRAERRAKFGLPVIECAGDPPTYGCTCLIQALDESGASSKRAILKRARGFHWSPPPRAREKTPVPQEAFAGPEEANGRAEDPSPQPKPAPKVEPPFRVVHRTPKWYDPKPNSIRDMQF